MLVGEEVVGPRDGVVVDRDVALGAQFIDQFLDRERGDAPPTLCDALQTPRVSTITYDVLRRRSAAALSVSDEDAFEAIRWAWREHELVVEPGGAVALAAVLTGKVEWVEDLVVIVSGGNIDPALHARIVA